MARSTHESLPAGGRLPPLGAITEVGPLALVSDTPTAAGKPLFGLRKMLAAKKTPPASRATTAESTVGPMRSAPSAAAPAAAADVGANRSGSVTFESGTFGGLNKPAKGGMFGMLQDLVSAPADGGAPAGKLFNLGFWGGAEAVVAGGGNADDSLNYSVSESSFSQSGGSAVFGDSRPGSRHGSQIFADPSRPTTGS